MKDNDEREPTNTVYSDLACERRKANVECEGICFTEERRGDYKWERITVTDKKGAESLGRPIGHYDTLTLPRMDTLTEEDIADAASEISEELCFSLDRISVIPDRILVVGLGNAELTPDSVGPKSALQVNATMHLAPADRQIAKNIECSGIAICIPGVMAKSGLDSVTTVKAISEKQSFDAVIAIDSLASLSPERLGKTIQISDTGIIPGSGIGCRRTPLNKESLGVPVIAIGVPTVINSKFFSYSGEINNSEQNSEMFVSPREIDVITDASSKIISMGINLAFGIF